MNRLILLIFLALPAMGFSKDWQDRKSEGWAWYEPVPKEVDQQDHESDVPSASETLSSIRADLEEKLAYAILHPTPENIGTYLKEQQKWLSQSQLFAQGWQKFLLSTPEYDNTNRVPVTQYGAQAHHQLLYQQKQQMFKQLAKEHGLFFFFAGKDPRCQIFAEVVHQFSTKYGWAIIPITLDGEALDRYPNPKMNTKILSHLSIKETPALLLVNPKTKEIIPISYGLSSLDQIESNIMLQLQPPKESSDEH